MSAAPEREARVAAMPLDDVLAGRSARYPGTCVGQT